MGAGWVPRGAKADPYLWRYDLSHGEWVEPGTPPRKNSQLIEATPGFDPRGRGQGFQVLLSPPGTPAPTDALSYTPVLRQVHGPGTPSPTELENLSVIPAPPPPSPAPPIPGLAPIAMGTAVPMPPPPVIPPPMPMPQAPPMPGQMPPQGLPPGAMPTPPTPVIGQPPAPMPPDDSLVEAPPVRMPSLYAQKAQDVLASLMTMPEAAMAPTGTGQDVGVGEDLTEQQTRALQERTRRYVGTPYAYGGNDLTRGIDCSGFVNEILKGFGANIPGRPSTVTYRNELATPISWDEIRPGDILLSAANPSNPGPGEHMALYVGGGQMAESGGARGRGVALSSVQGRNELRPYRMRTPVPGLQDATRLAQDAAANGPADTTIRLMSSQGQQMGSQPTGPLTGEPLRAAIIGEAMQRGGEPYARAVNAILLQEGGFRGVRGDSGNSAGPFHFHGTDQMAGQLQGYMTAVRAPNLEAARQHAQQNPMRAATWALDGYLWEAFQKARDQSNPASVLDSLINAQNGGTRDRTNYSRFLNDPLPASPGQGTPADRAIQGVTGAAAAGMNAIGGLFEQVLSGVGSTISMESLTSGRAAPTAGGTSGVGPIGMPNTGGAPRYIATGAPVPTAPTSPAPSPSGPRTSTPDWGRTGATAGPAPATTAQSAYPRFNWESESATVDQERWAAANPPTDPSAPYGRDTFGMPRSMPGTGPPGPVYVTDREGRRIGIMGAYDENGRAIDNPDIIAGLHKTFEALTLKDIQAAEQTARRLLAENEARWRHDLQERQLSQTAEMQTRRLTQEATNQAATDARTRQLAQDRIAHEQQQHGATLTGVQGLGMIPQRMAPYGWEANPAARTISVIGPNGERQTVIQGGPHIAKSGYMEGIGAYQERPNAQGEIERTYLDTPGRQQIVNGRVIQDTRQGLQELGRLSVDPKFTAVQDAFGGFMLYDAASGRTYRPPGSQGRPIVTQLSDGRVHTITPPDVPEYTDPGIRPTTFGAPEIPRGGSIADRIVTMDDGTRVLLKPGVQLQGAASAAPQFDPSRIVSLSDGTRVLLKPGVPNPYASDEADNPGDEEEDQWPT